NGERSPARQSRASGAPLAVAALPGPRRRAVRSAGARRLASRPVTSRRSASSARQDFREPVDVARSPALGDSNEHRVVEAFVVPPQGVPGVNSLCASVVDRLLRVPSDANGKLLERCPFRKQQLESGVHQATLRILAEAHAGLPHLLEALRTEPGEVYEPGQRQQRLVCGDVGGRLFAADVLLSRLQCEDIAALARGVYRLSDDPARHATNEL